MARDDFSELAANSEPGSMFDLLNQLGKALDEHDKYQAEVPPCDCGASSQNSWKHSPTCIWLGVSNDPPYDNALKIRLVDRAMEEADEYTREIERQGFTDRIEKD